MVDVRLSCDERRCAILGAAKRVFARLGFEGAKTKDIAKEAGVSEALIYRHFPSKETLHGALHDQLCAEKEHVLNYMASVPASTELLVFLHFKFAWLITQSGDNADGEAVSRLLFQNMLEDGGFAREFHEARFKRIIPKFAECLEAARAAGEVTDRELSAEEAVWFVHHIAVMVLFNGMPKTPVYDYRKNRRALVGDIVRYALRGIGLTPEAIERYYQPEAFEKRLEAVLSGNLEAAGFAPA